MSAATPKPGQRASRAVEDRQLLLQYSTTRDERLREELVERFLPLARGLARRYARSGEPLEDLVQVACVGLVKAIDRFEPARGTAFSTFAVPTIAGELKRHFRDHAWAAHVPRGMQEQALGVDRAIEELQVQVGRSPSVAEVARHWGKSEEQVVEAMEARAAGQPVSLDEQIASSDGVDTRADKLGASDDRYDLVEYAAAVAPAWEALGARERLLLRLRFYEGLTQSEIAEQIGVSQMQVSRLLRRTLDEMRAAVGTG